MLSQQDLKQTIRGKVLELARSLGTAKKPIADDDVLLETGALDSAAVLELLVWMETQLDIELDQDELSFDNFGSINQMAHFLTTRNAG
jgi:acyl carrier protein